MRVYLRAGGLAAGHLTLQRMIAPASTCVPVRPCQHAHADTHACCIAARLCCCRPQVIEMLKGGWIQWVATYIVLWYLLQWAEWFAFTNKFVTVRVVSDLQPKNQRF